MSNNHAHDLELVTRYGNGFSRFRCRTPSCDYWTDARDDERTEEIDCLRVEVERLTRERDEANYSKRAAVILADEVAVLVLRKVIDARSPAGDALLDYRNPPRSPRADRLAAIETERDALRTLVTQLVRALRAVALGEITSGIDASTWCWCQQPRLEVQGQHEPRCRQARTALAAAEKHSVVTIQSCGLS